MPNVDMKQAMHAAIEKLNAGDSKPYLDLLSADIRFTVTGSTRWSGLYSGKKDLLKRLLGPINALFEQPYRLIVESIVSEGEQLVVQMRGEITTKRGEPYNNRYCWVCRVRDGQICELTEYADTELFTKVLVA
jgi:ketosteroid isomerase-like protein